MDQGGWSRREAFDLLGFETLDPRDNGVDLRLEIEPRGIHVDGPSRSDERGMFALRVFAVSGLDPTGFRREFFGGRIGSPVLDQSPERALPQIRDEEHLQIGVGEHDAAHITAVCDQIPVSPDRALNTQQPGADRWKFGDGGDDAGDFGGPQFQRQSLGTKENFYLPGDRPGPNTE